MEDSRIRLAGSAMLAVGVIVAGWLLSGGIRHFKDSERVVTVKGLAEREVKADRVIWPLSYKEVGNDMLALYNAMESANANRRFLEIQRDRRIRDFGGSRRNRRHAGRALCPRRRALSL